jgi:hypothetical protein
MMMVELVYDDGGRNGVKNVGETLGKKILNL